ncbi:MAG: protein translocase subunit SecF [Candidatus Paceibacterota bacterium]
MAMSFNFVEYKKIWFSISSILVLTSLVLVVMWGLNPGIEFTGGSSLSVRYQEQPTLEEVRDKMGEFDFPSQVRLVGDKGVVVQIPRKSVGQDLQGEITNKLREIGEMQEESQGFETISSVIGEELKNKTSLIVFLSLFAILIYITFAFRKISRPIPSWQYGLATIIALFHDVMIPLGVFAYLGHQYGVQITIPIVTALLTVFGYSVNDTVVIFDRVRENLVKGEGVDYSSTVNFALNQTLTRSINTSLTTLFVLTAIFLVGGSTLHYFSLALILGVVCGTYSSLFLAAPLLAWWRERKITS